MKEAIYSRIRQVYICILAVYATLREVIPLQFIVSSNALSYTFFLGGLTLATIGVLYSKFSFKNKTSWILIAFFAVCVISTLVNYQYEFASNIKALGWMVLFFFLLYPYGAQISGGNSKALSPLFYTVIVTFLLLVFVSIPMYFFDVDYTYFNNNAMGIVSSQGFSSQYGRLWGVFQDANRGAVYVLIALTMAIYLFAKEHNLLRKIVLAISVFLFFCYIVLTLSRTAEMIMILICAWTGFYMVYTLCSFSKRKKMLFSLVACVLSMCICYGLFGTLTSAFPYVKRAYRQEMSTSFYTAVHTKYDDIYRLSGVNVIEGFLSNDNDAQESIKSEGSESGTTGSTVGNTLESKEDSALEELQRGDEKEDLSNGRFGRWKEGLVIFLESPLIGTSPRGAIAFAKVHCPETMAAIYGREIHSSFLDVLVGSGILGFVPIVVLLVITAWTILKSLFSYQFDKSLLLLSNTILALICFGALTSDLFFILSFGSVVFWIALGAVNRYKEDSLDA